MKIRNLILAIPFILFSCKKDKEQDPIITFTASPGAVYISNEGNFQSSNSSISYFNPANGNQTADIYDQVNNVSLGDICQSMNIINGKIYLVVNNSGKIEICDLYSLKIIKTISGLTSPRYIIPVNNSKAYVSDTYSNQLSVINLADNSISGTININGWTEQMLLKNDKVYVTNLQSEFLYVIDTLNNLVSDSILISRGGNSICEDKNGKIWVLCSGDYLLSVNGSMHRIDPTTKQVETSISFPASDYPTRLCINSSGDTIYFLNNGVWRMDVSGNSLPAIAFITSSGNNFYGLGIDKIKNEIYVSDAIDFAQKGKIFRYKADGTPVENFLAGIIPGDFLFLP